MIVLMCGVCVGVLRVRIHAAGVHHLDDRDGVRDDRWDVLLAECGELSLAVDVVFVGGVDSGIRVPVLGVLLLHEDEDVRVFPDQFLLRVHADVLPGVGHILWSCGVPGVVDVCATYI